MPSDSPRRSVRVEEELAHRAAETGIERARPALRRRKKGEHHRREHDRDRQQRHAHPPQRQLMRAQEAPAPGGESDHDQDRAKAKRLQQDIGEDRAPAAAEIADGGVGGVVDRRIRRCVAREGHGQEQSGGDQHQARPLQQGVCAGTAPALRAEASSASAGERSQPSPALLYSTLARRVSAVSVVSRSCTSATRRYDLPKFSPRASGLVM